MKLVIELIFVFLVVSISMYLILSGSSKKRRMNHRIKEFLPVSQAEEDDSKIEKRPPLSKQFILSLSNIFKNVQFSRKTEKMLVEAGSGLRPEEFFALRLLASAGSGLFTAFLGLPWFLSAIAVIFGYAIPHYFMKQKRKKRLTRLSYQLIEVLGMMANSMRAGFSFMQAMQLVGKEISDPLGPEFDRIVRQAGLGMPLEDVFEELIDRLPNKELEVVVQAILAQRKSGGNLAELLETMEETIRGRVRVLEELNTLTAQGRMSSWIITLLPIGLGLYLTFVSKDYFSPMLHHPLGWAMLTIGSVFIIIGWVVIQKIIRIEV
ncbi:type II secretion system F family protein [Neobacillus cucumis]|uniref:type II secretion system F family protein n=1 Tax=Neobacillus cucumis TaxID=1740721 RepID=UPI0018DF62C9|nr:type II secretion system F family protein [Neobacillus cucumis]MBI0577628.1 type II secretion system F family protein [Neobacillus cucumis]